MLGHLFGLYAFLVIAKQRFPEIFRLLDEGGLSKNSFSFYSIELPEKLQINFFLLINTTIEVFVKKGIFNLYINEKYMLYLGLPFD